MPSGAEAYLRDLPKAKLVWLDAGHFVLDENVNTVADEIKAVFVSNHPRVLIPNRWVRVVSCVMMNTPSRNLALLFGHERNVCNPSKTNVYS